VGAKVAVWLGVEEGVGVALGDAVGSWRLLGVTVGVGVSDSRATWVEVWLATWGLGGVGLLPEGSRGIHIGRCGFVGDRVARLIRLLVAVEIIGSRLIGGGERT